MAMASEGPDGLRVLRPDDWDVWYDTLLRAFGGAPEAAEERELWRELTEFDRFLGVWDGSACVGTAGAFSFRLTVPGGASVPAAGVTMVGVAATHRRRGVLTSMMRRQLDDVRSWGEPLAVLTASEPDIYGRFGYGVATYALGAELDTGRVRLSVPAGTDDVRLRYAAPAEVLGACEAVYAELVPRRPGMLARLPKWERVGLLDPESEREGASPLQCVVAERGDRIVGYARYRVKLGWGESGHDGTVILEELAAPDPAVDAALWRFLFGIDLTSTLVARGRPVDDTWQYLVSDTRRCGPAAGLAVSAAGGGGGRAGGADVRRPGGRGAGRGGRLLPVEHGALAAERGRQGSDLRADHGRGGSGAVRTGVGLGLSRRGVPRGACRGRAGAGTARRGADGGVGGVRRRAPRRGARVCRSADPGTDCGGETGGADLAAADVAGRSPCGRPSPRAVHSAGVMSLPAR
ncbi:N-acetyltransferase Eis [Streptomyces glaucescens]